MDNRELKKRLNRILDWEALEICPQEMGDELEVLIPYVMNDAAEHFLRLEGCEVEGGRKLPKAHAEAFSLVVRDDKQGLALWFDGDPICVWFEEATAEEHCYQYHNIGHEWRRIGGEEEIRRLVNLLCVLHDKEEYLGEAAIAPGEAGLARLIECAPICYFTPINESILDWYPETEEGIRAAAAFAEGTGLAGVFAQYLELTPEKRKRQRTRISELLAGPEGADFWQVVEKKIEKASMHWPRRNYGAAENLRNEKMRQRVWEKYRELGFEGDYPVMSRGDVTVRFAEEHPFTIMEEENFEFRIIEIWGGLNRE